MEDDDESMRSYDKMSIGIKQILDKAKASRLGSNSEESDASGSIEGGVMIESHDQHINNSQIMSINKSSDS